MGAAHRTTGSDVPLLEVAHGILIMPVTMTMAMSSAGEKKAQRSRGAVDLQLPLAEASTSAQRSFANDSIGRNSTKVIVPSQTLPLYQMIDDFPPILNGKLMEPGAHGAHVGVNLFPYADLLQAKEVLLAAKEAEATGVPQPIRRPPEKLNLAQKEERNLRTTVSALRSAVYEIILTQIAARDLPDADGDTGSDPYATFALLECDGDYDVMHRSQLFGRTEPLRNATHPQWHDTVKLWLPANTAPSISIACRDHLAKTLEKASKYMTQSEKDILVESVPPRVRIRVIDRDLGDDADDRLAEVILPLGPALAGYCNGVKMSACGKYKGQSQISFQYEIRPYAPTPPTMLTLHSIDMQGLDPPPKPATHARLYDKQTQGTAAKKGAKYAKPVVSPAEVAVGPYLRFTLLEVGQDLMQTVQTVPYASPLGLDLYLPKGSRRPPSIQVQLLDSTPDPVSGETSRVPIAVEKVRLGEEDGQVTTKLYYNKTSKKSGKQMLKAIMVKFAHKATVLEGEINSRLTRVGMVT